ncbi:biotin/lipoyl-containing protein, partial [Accumulibacter sp.]|uniref:biotin/lipoyl-containing protein n=1 Tax=Accumulibacter sp. TaxID=2053492 RepID=UPI001AC419C6
MSQLIEVRVPDIGDYHDVPVIDLCVIVGDVVKVDDALVTLESDKATMDVPSPVAGVVREIRVALGEKVSEGAVVVLLEAVEVAATTAASAVPAAPAVPPAAIVAAPPAAVANAAAPVEVLGERTRVLLLAGNPNREFQILRNLLIRDKTIDATCWLQSADPKFPQDGDEGVRIDKLPEERQQFEPYDVVIFVDPNAEKLSAAFCQNLQQHIVENGCGLWWVAGEQYSLDAMRPAARTAKLADLLPILPDIDYAERQIVGFGKAFVRPWQFALAPEGEDGVAAKITRIVDGKDERRILWSRLPGFHFWFPVLRLKPVAVCAVEHTDPELRREGRGMPMVALQNVGAGR